MNRDAAPTPATPFTIQQRRALTDSPWFWVLVFSGMACVALTAMEHKFGRRQTQVEGPFKTRQFNANKAAGRPPAQPAEADFDVDYSAPERTIVSLGPLRFLALAVMCVATVVLARERLADFRTRAAAPTVNAHDEDSR